VLDLSQIQELVTGIHSAALKILVHARLDRASRQELQQMVEESAEALRVISEIKAAKRKPGSYEGALARFSIFSVG
jgi:hypothetical protein